MASDYTRGIKYNAWEVCAPKAVRLSASIRAEACYVA